MNGETSVEQRDIEERFRRSPCTLSTRDYVSAVVLLKSFVSQDVVTNSH